MSTFLSLHYHIVFSTKDRRPTIRSDWMGRLHKYFGGTVNGLGGKSKGVGGVEDHVHLIVGLQSAHCLADFMRELKKASSIWVHKEIGDSTFSWQEGYGAFNCQPQRARRCPRLYIQSTRTSPETNVPRRICGFSRKSRSRI